MKNETNEKVNHRDSVTGKYGEEADTIKLDDIACDCIDTATPDTETTFPCGWCNDEINWRKSINASHYDGKHWHDFCLLECLLNKKSVANKEENCPHEN